jgi:hypothetical protein
MPSQDWGIPAYGGIQSMRQVMGETGCNWFSHEGELHSVTVTGTISGFKDLECYFLIHSDLENIGLDKYGNKN